ncbi:MAG: hypothetical protein E7053_10620 [Lentisphaerae bacterium]|nr:hypothetical protein [Lentisphaerota bacterium]
MAAFKEPALCKFLEVIAIILFLTAVVILAITTIKVITFMGGYISHAGKSIILAGCLFNGISAVLLIISGFFFFTLSEYLRRLLKSNEDTANRIATIAQTLKNNSQEDQIEEQNRALAAFRKNRRKIDLHRKLF